MHGDGTWDQLPSGDLLWIFSEMFESIFGCFWKVIATLWSTECYEFIIQQLFEVNRQLDMPKTRCAVCANDVFYKFVFNTFIIYNI